MTLERLLGRLALIGSVSVFGYNCDSATPEPTSCIKDTDCKGERVCISGVCQQQGSYGGADTSGSNKYTCESGSKMIVDLCCPLMDYKDCHEAKIGGDIYKHMLEDCNSKSISSYSNYFNCTYDICKNKKEPIKTNLKQCESAHLKNR